MRGRDQHLPSFDFAQDGELVEPPTDCSPNNYNSWFFVERLLEREKFRLKSA